MADRIPTYTPNEGLDVGSSFGVPDFSQAPANALGEAADVAGVLAERRLKRQDELERFKAEQGFIQWQLGNGQTLENAGQNIQPGGQGLHDQVLGDAESRRETYLSTIPEYLRPDYDLRTQRATGELSLTAAGAENDARDVWFRNQLQQSADQLLPIIQQQGLPGLERFAQAQIDQINASSLSPADKEIEIAKWRAMAQLAVAEGMQPEDLIAIISPASHLEAILTEAESGGRPDIVNDLGYAGLYQFGAPRLETLGLYTPGAEEEMGTWSDTPRQQEGKWTGRFSIPGFTEVQNLADFLANPGAQRAAWNYHMGEIGEQITSRGLDQYIGQEMKGVVVTREGIMAMAHLGGIGGAERFLESNGSYDPGDSNETRLSAYLRKGGEAMSAGPLDALPYTVRNQLVADARSAIVRRDTATAAAETENRQARMNDLMVGILDGTAGYAEVGMARREGWLTDYADIKRAIDAIDTRDREAIAEGNAVARFADPSQIFNPFAKEDRDDTDRIYRMQGGDANLLSGTEEQQGAAVRRVRDIAARTGIIPETALTALRGGIWSPNTDQRNLALRVLDGLTRENPALINQLTDSDRTRLQDYQALAGAGVPVDELNERFDVLTDPAHAAAQETLRQQGLVVARELSDGEIMGHFDPGLFERQPGAPTDPYQHIAFRAEFERVFAERYSVSGSKDVAMTQAIERMAWKWGSTDLMIQPGNTLPGMGPTTNTTRMLMPFPPERYYPAVNGSHDWMQDDLTSLATERYPGFQSIYLRPTAETEGALQSGAPPYEAVIVDRNGVMRFVPNVVFDYEKYRAQAEADLAAHRQHEAEVQTYVTETLQAIEENPNLIQDRSILDPAEILRRQEAGIGPGTPPTPAPEPAPIVTPGGTVTPATSAPTYTLPSNPMAVGPR